MTLTSADGTVDVSGPPLSVFRAEIWFDELDPVGVLHNARYAIHAERAMTSWFTSQPELVAADQAGSPDAYHLVKAYEIDFRAPITGAGPVAVELRVARLGRTGCTFEFRFVAVDEAEPVVHAVGRRTIVKIDDAKRPAPWSDAFRRVLGA